jgi:hypothetical protein
MQDLGSFINTLTAIDDLAMMPLLPNTDKNIAFILVTVISTTIMMITGPTD